MLGRPIEIGQSLKLLEKKLPKETMEPPTDLVVNKTTEDEVILCLNLSEVAYQANIV